MKRFSEAVVRHRRMILIASLIACALSAYAMQSVTINYDMASYLPKDAPSTQALAMLDEALPNMQVYLPDVTPQQAVEAKQRLLDIEQVQAAMWLDDIADLKTQPFNMIPEATSAPFYAEGGALIQLTVDAQQSAEAFAAIRALYPDALFKGEAANQARLSSVTMGEVASIMYYVIPLVLIILLLSTDHWLEPVFFLIVISVAILINEGTNIMLGNISFVTQACSAVLQLAVSIDYAVFLLHRFSEYRDKGMNAVDAMKMAMQKSASAIASSAMTTIFGFLALLVMNFGMGYDMGIVLAKGVTLSYISVMVLLPALVITFIKALDKTAHRKLMPSFRCFGKAVTKRGAVIAIIVLLLLPFAYLGQLHNDFVYGSSGMHAAGSPVKQEAMEIDRMFGQTQMMLLMVPEGNPMKTANLAEELSNLPVTVSITSYANTAGVQIPRQILPEAAASQFFDKGYERIILSVSTNEEGKKAFQAVEDIRSIVQSYYQDSYYMIGENVVNYDLMYTITGDNLKVLFAGIAAIGLILLITFKNLSIPVLLILIIEGAIWLNMSVPYFMGDTMNYIGYQIVSSVQLGATIDYGILLTQRYLEARKTMKKKDAAAWALSIATGSILPPVMILTIAGYALSIVVSSNGVISQMGEIIGRGAFISGFMVLFVLPQVLMWFDSLIQKTSLSRCKEKKENA
ncbi:MAG: efflux RND transporter permease subunit [Christensenellales bacterium]|jgi:predicted RND superfamily exporter protein